MELQSVLLFILLFLHINFSNGLASHQASSSTVCAPPLMSDPPNPPSAPKAPPPPLPAFWRKSGTSCWASDRTLTRSDAMEVSKSAPLK